jgi:hypothetical protein
MTLWLILAMMTSVPAVWSSVPLNRRLEPATLPKFRNGVIIPKLDHAQFASPDAAT